VDATAEMLQKNAPIKENEHVKALWAILRENFSPSHNDYATIIKQVTAMENQLDTMIGELATMRKQLTEAQAINHPAESVMQKAVAGQQSMVEDLRDKLGEIKESIIDGCKNAVDAFKEKGVSALNSIADFFKIKPMLASVCDGLDKTIVKDNKAINRIETISKEYHETGLHLKNIGRAILGKETQQEVKPVGKITQAFCKPNRTQRSCCESMKSNLQWAIVHLSRLEERAAKHKPSVIATMENFERQSEPKAADTPAQTADILTNPILTPEQEALVDRIVSRGNDKSATKTTEEKPSVLGTMEKYEKKIAQDKKDSPASEIKKTIKDNKDER
jgi:vacuolar-type H+-ATPase subunit H